MMKSLLAALLALLPLGAQAANCSSNPFTLQNGQTADATQVMSNFNNLLTCANNNLAHNGANSDITSLSGLSTPLATSEGGSGVAAPTANTVLLGNGASAFQTVAPSTSGNVLLSNGTTWNSVAGGSLALLQTQTASGASTVDFTSQITSAYSVYEFVLTNILPTTSGASLQLQVSVNNGSSWKTGAGDYFRIINTSLSNSTQVLAGANGEAAMILAFSLSNVAANSLTGKLNLLAPASASTFLTPLNWKLGAFGNGGSSNLAQFLGTGIYPSGAAVNGIRFKMDSGSLSGTISMYARRI